MKDSPIEWTDHTFNPWHGCTKVSPGCANCYAEALNKRWGHSNWGKGSPRRRTSEANWKEPLKWNREAAKTGTRPRVFCASMADWLDDEVPFEWLADLLRLIHDTPNLDWLLLTKRPENWYQRVSLVEGELAESWIDCIDMPERGDIPQNIWIGVTVENQEQADKRIPELLKIPAKVRFLSCEPLLGRVVPPLYSHKFCEECKGSQWVGDNGPGIRGNWEYAPCEELPASGIHWVICGGESGPNARPMHPDWARSLRDQCQAAGVPFFFKQWGEWFPRDQWEYSPSLVLPDDCCAYCNSDGTHVFSEENCFQYPVHRIGKKKAGRLLDGAEHNEIPPCD